MKLELAEEEAIQPEAAELDDKVSSEQTKVDLGGKDSEEDCDGGGELAYL